MSHARIAIVGVLVALFIAGPPAFAVGMGRDMTPEERAAQDRHDNASWGMVALAGWGAIFCCACILPYAYDPNHQGPIGALVQPDLPRGEQRAGHPALHRAVFARDHAEARRLLADEPGLVRERNAVGRTARDYATRLGDDTMLDILDAAEARLR